jgi:hypothetical protein
MSIHVHLAELVERQYGAIGRWQLLNAGFTERQIDRRVSSQRFVLLARGIYTLAGAEHSWEQRAVAAWLISADRTHSAALSHRTAAAFLGFPGFDRVGSPYLLASSGSRHPNPLGMVMRRRDLEPSDLIRHESGVTMTNPVRTTIDLLMSDARPAKAELLLNSALSSGLVDLASLQSRFAPLAAANRAGVAHVKPLLLV